MCVQQTAERGLPSVFGHALREVRNDDSHVGCVGRLADLQIGGFARKDLDRLLPENHIHVAREPAHQMLRPLEHEVPSQVRKANEGIGLRVRHRGLGFGRYWHPDTREHFPYILLVRLARE